MTAALEAGLAERFGTLQRRSLVVGLGASVVLLVGAVLDLDSFFRSWLPAFLFWLGLGLSLIHI